MGQRNDEIEPRWAHNLASVVGWDRYRWMSWFLEAADDRGANTEPLRLDSRANLGAEVSELYGLARESVRRPMREGVADALAAWNIAHHSFAILMSLGYLAAALQAPEALPKLLDIVRSHRALLTSTDDDDQIGVAEFLLSVIGGFPSEPIIEATFSDLLMDNDVAPELTALLAISVCKSSPRRFLECFSRYWERRSELEDFFDDEAIVAAFADVVPSEIRNPLVPQLAFDASTLWIRAGKAAAVVASHEILPPDAEGRPNVVDDDAIPTRTDPSFDEGKSRHDIAFDDPDEILRRMEAA